MKKAVVPIVVLLGMYLILSNLTGWALIQNAKRLLPYPAQYQFEPSFEWGKVRLKNVSLRVQKDIKVRAERLTFQYSPEQLLFSNGIPLTITSRDLVASFEAGVGGFSLPLECQFDSFRAALNLKSGKHIDVNLLQAHGKQLTIEGEGWVNLKKDLVDMQVRLTPEESVMRGLLASIQDEFFLQDNKQGSFVLKISGNVAHPAVHFQSDLVKVTFQ